MTPSPISAIAVKCFQRFEVKSIRITLALDVSPPKAVVLKAGASLAGNARRRSPYPEEAAFRINGETRYRELKR
jgi:Tfp pilus assembly major pilin PilA